MTGGLEELIDKWQYSFLFIGAGMLFLFLEVFVPSGGILGFLSLGCSVFGVYGLFHQGHPFIGLGAIIGIAIVTALGIRYGLRRLTFTGTLAVENPALAPGESLPSLVGTITANQHLFDKDFFRERLKNNPFVESLA